jgi:hypothetical protein
MYLSCVMDTFVCPRWSAPIRADSPPPSMRVAIVEVGVEDALVIRSVERTVAPASTLSSNITQKLTIMKKPIFRAASDVKLCCADTGFQRVDSGVYEGGPPTRRERLCDWFIAA